MQFGASNTARIAAALRPHQELTKLADLLDERQATLIPIHCQRDLPAVAANDALGKGDTDSAVRYWRRVGIQPDIRRFDRSLDQLSSTHDAPSAEGDTLHEGGALSRALEHLRHDSARAEIARARGSHCESTGGAPGPRRRQTPSALRTHSGPADEEKAR